MFVTKGWFNLFKLFTIICSFWGGHKFQDIWEARGSTRCSAILLHAMSGVYKKFLYHKITFWIFLEKKKKKPTFTLSASCRHWAGAHCRMTIWGHLKPLAWSPRNILGNIKPFPRTKRNKNDALSSSRKMSL